MNRRLSVLTVFGTLMSLGLVACSPPRYVPVEERKTITARAEVDRIGGHHVRFVQPRDTLYSISFSAGLDVNLVAAWNKLSDTSKLRVGQQIRLTEPIGFVPMKKTNVVQRSSQLDERRDSADRKNNPIILKPIGSRPKNDPAKPANNKKIISVLKFNVKKWYWPTKGKVIAWFSVGNGRQGIDILGKLGQPVLSSGRGEVVYVGNGLKGYGNLVIIKHNAHYLSAYAHNRETFVREGEQVTAKQRIGSMGYNNQGKSALHFQVRKDGTPVNPLSYLPKI